MNFEKSNFSRMKDPVSRLKRGRQRVRRQVRLNAGGNNFFENFGNEVDNKIIIIIFIYFYIIIIIDNK